MGAEHRVGQLASLRQSCGKPAAKVRQSLAAARHKGAILYSVFTCALPALCVALLGSGLGDIAGSCRPVADVAVMVHGFDRKTTKGKRR